MAANNIYKMPAPSAVIQPVLIVTGNGSSTGFNGTLNLVTSGANNTVGFNIDSSTGVVGVSITGLTASGATLNIEGSDDGNTTWSAINGLSAGSGILFNTITTDQQFRINTSGRSAVRFRVSPTGTGNVSIGYTISDVGGLTALATPVPPGNNNIGQVSSTQGEVVITPTVTSGSAYSAGQLIGGLLTVTGGVRGSGLTGLLQKVIMNTKSAQNSQVDLIVFKSNPSSTTFTDKTTYNLNVADFDKVIGIIHISDWTSHGTPSTGQGSTLALPVKATGSALLYACMVARGTPTFGSTSDVSLSLQIIQD